jgi:predicted DNA-binding transcriptional regulator AlpA
MLRCNSLAEHPMADQSYNNSLGDVGPVLTYRRAREELDCQKTKFFHLMKTDPSFPRPIRVGGAPRIIKSELDHWLSARREERDAARSDRVDAVSQE